MLQINIFSSRKAQGGVASWYAGIAWAHRTRWRSYSLEKRQTHAFGRITDPFRLWALLKSRGKQEIAGFHGGIKAKLIKLFKGINFILAAFCCIVSNLIAHSWLIFRQTSLRARKGERIGTIISHE